jgi:hypothetical protein
MDELVMPGRKTKKHKKFRRNTIAASRESVLGFALTDVGAVIAYTNPLAGMGLMSVGAYELVKSAKDYGYLEKKKLKKVL